MKYNGAEKQKQSCVWIISQVLFIQQTGHSKMALAELDSCCSCPGQRKGSLRREGREKSGEWTLALGCGCQAGWAAIFRAFLGLPRQLLRSVQGPSSSLSLVSMAAERSLLHFWWKC